MIYYIIYIIYTRDLIIENQELITMETYTTDDTTQVKKSFMSKIFGFSDAHPRLLLSIVIILIIVLAYSNSHSILSYLPGFIRAKSSTETFDKKPKKKDSTKDEEASKDEIKQLIEEINELQESK